MYIARQPIFKTNLEVYGYELLYRSGKSTIVFDGADATQATATVLAGLFEAGIEEITNRKKAFINFDAHFLNEDLPEFIDSNHIVIEVLEDVVVDDHLVARVVALRKKGYIIALDDFTEHYDEYPLTPHADIIKFDLLATPLDTITYEIKKAIRQNKILLAEKIEDEVTFTKAKALGFTLFQGFFFSKPKIINRTVSKINSRTQYVRILMELKKEEPSYQLMAEIIERDLNLAYRLLRVVKTRSGDDVVYSIKRALTYLGLNEIERWINILMVQDLGADKPKELMAISLIRSKFAEAICKRSGFKKIKYEASMMGLFSTIDAMLDMDMKEAMINIALPDNIKDALVNQKGALFPVYQLIMAYEQADFERSELLARELDLSDAHLQEDYIGAIKWSNEMTLLID